MQFHTRPLKKVGFCGCQTSSAILRNKCCCVGQKLPRNDQRTARRWLDQWPLQNIFYFCWRNVLESIKVNAWVIMANQDLLQRSLEKWLTISVLVHHGFLHLSNHISCKHSFPGVERQSDQIGQYDLFYITIPNYPIFSEHNSSI